MYVGLAPRSKAKLGLPRRNKLSTAFEGIKATKELPIMDSRVFTDDTVAGVCDGRQSYSIRLDVDSYIICFTGGRGGGKTTAMTAFVVRSVALYNMRVVSNYPIEFMLRRYRDDGQSYLQHVKAEPLNFEKLLLQDDDYEHVLICIDEAPDIISHMASQTWKNRLVAAFTRQIRKNYNSLFLAAQNFDLIDKSMRWQVDVVTNCQDASRAVGDNSGVERGEVIWLKFYDNSGLWTNKTTEERIAYGEVPYVGKAELFPRLMWGDDEHKAVYDSWYQIDILDSLRKVDLRMSSIKVGDKANGTDSSLPRVSSKALNSAVRTIELLFEERPDSPLIYQADFWDSLGGVTKADKDALGKLLTHFNIERGRDSSTNKRWYGFGSFDTNGLRSLGDSL